MPACSALAEDLRLDLAARGQARAVQVAHHLQLQLLLLLWQLWHQSKSTSGAEEGASHTIPSLKQPMNSARHVFSTEGTSHVGLYCLHGVRYRRILLERAHAEPQRVVRL